MEKSPELNLEMSNNQERELINLVNKTEDFESLADLAFENKLIGYKFNPLRYEHLKEVKGGEFSTSYPDYDREDGYLIGPDGKTDTHITQIYDERTDEAFFESAKPTMIEFLSLQEEDFEQSEESPETE